MIKKLMVTTIALVFTFLSCGKTARSKSVIKIGSIQQLTGQMSKYGETHVAATQAMLELINKERADKKLPLIKLIVEDDQLDPAKGVNIIKKMIDVDKVIAVLGAQGSSVTLAMAPIAEKKKVVLISGASTAPKISDAGDYIFRTCPSDIYEGEYTARIYDSLFSRKKLAILFINNDYGNGLKNAFISNVKTSPEVPLDVSFDQGATDLRSQLALIARYRAEVIYLIGYEEMISAYRQAKELGLHCVWLGNNQLNDQSMVNKMGNTADGTIFPGQTFSLEDVKAKYPEFYQNYLERSKGEELDMFAAYGVDALMVINYVLLNGAKTSTDIKNALYQVHDFPGITGRFSFDKKGDVIRPLALFQIQNGKIIRY
jgi:branched-chain amino acid transport system substrate-binding protein